MLLVALLYAAYHESAGDGLTWERPATYLLAVLSLPFGFYRLIRLARHAHAEHPSYFLLGIIYETACFFAVYVAVSVFALNDLYPGVPVISEDLTFALLVAAIFMTSIVNFVVLFLGGRHGTLEEPADPVPFRVWLRRVPWRGRRRG